MNQVEHIIQRVKNLPPLPAVVQQVLRLVQDPDYSMDQVMDTIRLDPGITASVLRMCNSPVFGLRQPVSSLQQALLLMGSDQLMAVILSGEVVGHYKTGQDGYRMAKGNLWQHSMATALLAQRLGERLKHPDASTLFTSALLHDVGKLVLSEFVQKDFDKIEKLVADGLSFVSAERQVLGVDHALLGAALAKQWNFPAPIITAIAFHHAPDQAKSDQPLVNLVALSNLLCMSLGVGGAGAYGLAASVPPGLLKEVGLRSRDLDALLLELKDITDQAQEMLSLAV